MNKFSMLSNNRTSQSGMTFLEVLIAMVIIVTGVLGAVAMQATAKQASFDAMQRSLASSLAQDIIARIRTNNPTNLAAYVASDYGSLPLGDEPDSRCDFDDAPCDSAGMAANDIYEWELALAGGDVTSGSYMRGGLVGGQGCISQVVGSPNALIVVVAWKGRTAIQDSVKSASCGDSGENTRRQVIVQAFII